MRKLHNCIVTKLLLISEKCSANSADSEPHSHSIRTEVSLYMEQAFHLIEPNIQLHAYGSVKNYGNSDSVSSA